MMTVQVKNWIVMSSLALVSFAGMSSCDKDNDDDNRNYTLSGNANGSQMVPAVTGTGSGTMTGSYNPNNRTMTYTSTWAGLSGAPTSAAFYTGGSGVGGTQAGTAWTLPAGMTGTGTYSGTMVLTPEQATQLTSGNYYYSYGTANNSNGEVRGQMNASR